MSDRFWSKVDRSGGPDACWPWMAYRQPKGYGIARHDGRLELAHRVAWMLENGPIPDGLCALHKCDNRPCANPSHLFLGTNVDNVRDRDAKGRGGSARGERNRHAKLSASDIPWIRAWRGAGFMERVIAAEYGVSQATVSSVSRRTTWEHVQ